MEHIEPVSPYSSIDPVKEKFRHKEETKGTFPRYVHQGRAFIGRLEAGDDLLEGLLRIAIEEKIEIGTVHYFGAVTTAT